MNRVGVRYSLPTHLPTHPHILVMTGPCVLVYCTFPLSLISDRHRCRVQRPFSDVSDKRSSHHHLIQSTLRYLRNERMGGNLSGGGESGEGRQMISPAGRIIYLVQTVAAPNRVNGINRDCKEMKEKKTKQNPNKQTNKKNLRCGRTMYPGKTLQGGFGYDQFSCTKDSELQASNQTDIVEGKITYPALAHPN